MASTMTRSRLVLAGGVLALSAAVGVTAVAMTRDEGAVGATGDVRASVALPTTSPTATVAPPVVATPATVSTVSRDSALVATAVHGVTVYRRPDGRVLTRLSARTELGAVRTLLVTGKRDGWVQVLVPIRPNNTLGWIRPAAATVTPTPLRIEVSRAHKTLTVLRAGTPVVTYPVAVGAPATPTPRGLFSITDRLPTLDPYGPYGPYAFGLSGYSDVLTSFDGGDGVLGIHGTNADWSIGHAASHGCIRLHNRDIQALFKLVPLGTPVFVH
jgi:lipoprotein-anchoring transpeptidase ErfK/SrfK